MRRVLIPQFPLIDFHLLLAILLSPQLQITSFII